MSNKKHILISLAILFWTGCEDLDMYNNPVKVSVQNEMFNLEISADTDILSESSATLFSVTVSRIQDYFIRYDSRIIGEWDLYSMTVDSQTINISQFPTGYDFFEDGSYTEQVTNTITNDITFSSGAWSLALNFVMTLTELGEETSILVSFDTDSITVPVDGFMVWDYTSADGKIVHMELKKYSETDASIFLEYTPYLSVITSPNSYMDAYTQEATLDIPIYLNHNRGEKYVFSGLFTPGVGVDRDVITASFDSEDYGLLTVQLPITIRLGD